MLALESEQNLMFKMSILYKCYYCINLHRYRFKTISVSYFIALNDNFNLILSINRYMLNNFTLI